ARVNDPKPIRLRLAAAVLMLLVFRIVAWSPVQADEPRGSAFHIIGGYAENMDVDMGLRPASYIRNLVNSDPWNNGFVNHYNEHVLGSDEPVPYISEVALAPGR